MMGLNNQGELHVWLNENFAVNNVAKGIENEAMMVEEIQ